MPWALQRERWWGPGPDSLRAPTSAQCLTQRLPVGGGTVPPPPAAETGVADRGDDLRVAMIDGYMAEVRKVVERGYDLR